MSEVSKEAREAAVVMYGRITMAGLPEQETARCLDEFASARVADLESQVSALREAVIHVMRDCDRSPTLENCCLDRMEEALTPAPGRGGGA